MVNLLGDRMREIIRDNEEIHRAYKYNLRGIIDKKLKSFFKDLEVIAKSKPYWNGVWKTLILNGCENILNIYENTESDEETESE